MSICVDKIKLLKQKIELLRKLKIINHKLNFCLFDIKDLKQAGFSVKELQEQRRIPFDIINFYKRNYDILIDVGYTPEEINIYLKRELRLREKREIKGNKIK